MGNNLHGKKDKQIHDIYFLGGVLKGDYTKGKYENPEELTIEDFEKFLAVGAGFHPCP